MLHHADSLLIEEQPAIDRAWHGRLRQIVDGMREAYELLRPSDDRLAAAKQAFFADRTYNPDLRPTLTEEQMNDDITLYRNDLGDFKDELEDDESLLDLPIRLSYLWRGNELITNLDMVKAAAEGDMAGFDGLNQQIYGRPNPEIFAAEVDWFRELAGEQLHNAHPAVQEAAIAALQALTDRRGESASLSPEPETFQRIREDHWRRGGYYALLFAGATLPESGPVTPEMARPILEQVRHNVGADDYRLIARGTTWSVSHDRKELTHSAKNVALARLIGLTAHELGTHTIERTNGDRQPIRLLGLGLAGYEKGNEGRAVIREQVAYEAFEAFARQPRWQDIMRRHMAIALATGVSGIGQDVRAHDGQPRSFSEVFRIMNAVDRFLERVKTPENPVAADHRADDRTWNLLTRVLKGTDGTGGAYYKDMVYLEGNIACWDLARRHPELIAAGDLGKFNITNPWHIDLLKMYGILPESETVADV